MGTPLKVGMSSARADGRGPTETEVPALRIRTLERKIEDLNGRIEAEVEASGTALTEIFGIGPMLAARIIGTVGNVARFPTKAHFASYSGTAPAEASSGNVWCATGSPRWPGIAGSTSSRHSGE
jgi:transposase